ncbi:MAG: ACT domain-containing protein [Candidatus Micrarchaeota archaeon]|nr:ACT domain-containing protein [Candidatus Micrarchaeota archaeon]
MAETKIADLVRTYLKNKPYTMEALESGIVNFSSLSRLVQKELNIGSYQAVKAAVRRYAAQIGSMKGTIEKRALEVLKENRITLLDGVYVIISSQKMDIDNKAEVKVDSYYVYLTDKNAFKSMTRKQKSSLIKVHENCSAIIIYSEEKLENVSGVLAFVTSLLAERSINVIEFISCYTETMLIVSKEDALRSYEALSEIIR